MRRTRRVTPPTIAFDEAYAPLIERIKTIIATHREEVWKLLSPFMTTVKREDETFRKVTITDQEFFLTGVRAGARGNLIFEFEPIDTQPFVSMELNDKDVHRIGGLHDMLMSELGGTLGQAMLNAKREFASGKKEEVAETQAVVKQEQTVKYSESRDWGSW